MSKNNQGDTYVLHTYIFFLFVNPTREHAYKVTLETILTIFVQSMV